MRHQRPPILVLAAPVEQLADTPIEPPDSKDSEITWLKARIVELEAIGPRVVLDPANHQCSFCTKSSGEVFTLIQGHGGAFICDECVAFSAEILAARASPTKRGRPPGSKTGSDFGRRPHDPREHEALSRGEGYVMTPTGMSNFTEDDIRDAYYRGFADGRHFQAVRTEARRSKKKMTFKRILQAMSANRIDTYGDIHFPGDRIWVLR